jgi:hypothetical protein
MPPYQRSSASRTAIPRSWRDSWTGLRVYQTTKRTAVEDRLMFVFVGASTDVTGIL